MNTAPFKDIVALVKSMHRLARQAEVQYTKEVDAIITARCRDPKRIEHILDGILDFCFDSAMLSLYKRLSRYYFKIDQAATASYVKAYRDMWDEEPAKHNPSPRK